MNVNDMEGRDPIKCDFCDINISGHCHMFGMSIQCAVEYPCHMDEENYDIGWDVCCSYIDGKVIPKCDHFTMTEIKGKNGLFGECKKVGMVFYLRWFLGKKVCGEHAEPKPKQMDMGGLR